jgi:hypothetical protein
MGRTFLNYNSYLDDEARDILENRVIELIKAIREGDIGVDIRGFVEEDVQESVHYDTRKMTLYDVADIITQSGYNFNGNPPTEAGTPIYNIMELAKHTLYTDLMDTLLFAVRQFIENKKTAINKLIYDIKKELLGMEADLQLWENKLMKEPRDTQEFVRLSEILAEKKDAVEEHYAIIKEDEQFLRNLELARMIFF